MSAIEQIAAIDWPVRALTLAIQASVVLGAALILATKLRRHSPSFRHWLWGLIFVLVVALPLVSGLTPRWCVPILPVGSSSQDEAGADLAVGIDSVSSARAVEPAAGKRLNGVHAKPSVSNRPGSKRRRWATLATGAGLALWISGSTLMAAVIVLGGAQIRLLARGGDAISDRRWRNELERLRSSLGIRRSVRLVSTPTVSIPMTGGFFHPVIALPPAATDWDAQRIHVVLLHELIHVRRNDWLTDLMGQLARAMYWFNPLMWIALRDWRLASEQCCDERVVANGTKPSSYAKLLMDLAGQAGPRRHAWSASPAMARRHHLEERLMTILEPQSTNRIGVVTLPLLAAFLAFAVMTAVLIQPVRRSSPRVDEGDRGIWLTNDDNYRFLGPMRTADGDEYYMKFGDPPNGFAVEQRFPDGFGLVMRRYGDVEFDADSGEIVSLGRDARVMLATEHNGIEFQLDVEPDADGELRHTFRVNGEPTEFDQPARNWADDMFSASANMAGIADIKREANELRGQALNIKGAVLRRRGSIANIRGKVATLKGRIGGIRGEAARRRALGARLDFLHKRVAASRDQMAELGGMLAMLAKKNEPDLLRIEETRKKIADRSEQVVDLMRQIENIDASDELNSEEPEAALKEQVDKRIADVREKIDAVDADARIAELQQQIEALDADERIAELQMQIDAVNADERIAVVSEALTPMYGSLRQFVDDNGLRYLAGVSFDPTDGIGEGEPEDGFVEESGQPEELDKADLDPEDPWDRYVLDFIDEHGLEGSRGKRAMSILATSKKLRNRVLRAGEAKTRAAGVHRKSAVRKRTDDQVDRIFESVLVRNLERLASQQRRRR